VKNVLRHLRDNAPRLVPALLLLVLLALLLTGCDAKVPQNTFDAGGEVARKQRNLFYMAMWPAIVVMIGVLGGIVVICLRFRERDPKGLPPKQMHGNTPLELAWTIIPAVLLLGLGVPMVSLISELGSDPGPDAYYIDVRAERFNFFFDYPDIKDPAGTPLETVAEAHIPTGRRVAFRLHSTDVIHSFWVPRLGGKLDVVPNMNNVLWLVADNPDSFSGQCAELCGTGHANMKFVIHADSPSDFDAWVAEQQATLNATPAPTPSPKPGASATPTPAASGEATPTPTPEASASPTPTGS
jgi:cytochrome c oxidase subunit 2